MDINLTSQIFVYTNLASFPATGAAKTFYVADDTEKLYRWTGSAYVEVSSGSVGTTWGAITGTLSNQTDLETALNTKEPTITAGTTSQYYRGDKSFQTLDTSIVPENTNLYFTTTRAIGSTLTGYISGAGVISAADTVLGAIQKLNGNISGLSAYTFSTGLTNNTGTITNNLSTGVLGGQTINGGTAASDVLTISSTTHATKGRIQIGSTDIVNIGNATTTNQRLVRIGQDTAIIDLGSLVGTTNQGAMYLTKATPSSTNYSISADSSGNTYVNAENGFSVQLRTNNVTRVDIGGTYMSFTSGASTTSALVPYTFTTPSSTGQTASTETIGFRVNMSASIQHATGAITTQRDFVIDARTHTAVASSTITTAATLAITSAPTAGTNVTITNAYALWVQAGTSRFESIVNIANSNGSANLKLGATTFGIDGGGAAYIAAAGNTFKILNAAVSVNMASFGNFTSYVNSSLFVGGITNATAFLDCAASTTSTASIRIRSGSAPTSPNNGDIWFDGTDIKMRIGGTTKTFTLT